MPSHSSATILTSVGGRSLTTGKNFLAISKAPWKRNEENSW